MEIKAYCPLCKSTFSYDFLPEDTDEAATADGGIPLPQTPGGSGLHSFSVIHNDHILVLEVDRNGDVRKTDTVKLVETASQRIIAELTAELWEKAEQGKNQNILVLTQRPLWIRLFQLLGSQLLIDMNQHPSAEFKVSYLSSVFDLSVNKITLQTIQDPSVLSEYNGWANDVIIDATTLLDREPVSILSQVSVPGTIVLTISETLLGENDITKAEQWIESLLDTPNDNVVMFDSSHMKNAIKILKALLSGQ